MRVRSEPLVVFIERESKALLEEGWTAEGDPNDHATSWSPPWARERKYPITEAVNERSRRFLEAWAAAGRPDDVDGFFSAWVRGFRPS